MIKSALLPTNWATFNTVTSPEKDEGKSIEIIRRYQWAHEINYQSEMVWTSIVNFFEETCGYNSLQDPETQLHIFLDRNGFQRFFKLMFYNSFDFFDP